MEDHLNEFEPKKKQVPVLDLVYEVITTVGLVLMGIQFFRHQLKLSAAFIVVFALFKLYVYIFHRNPDEKKVQ